MQTIKRMWKAIFQNKLTIYRANLPSFVQKIIKSCCYVDLSCRLRLNKCHPKMAAWEKLNDLQWILLYIYSKATTYRKTYSENCRLTTICCMIVLKGLFIWKPLSRRQSGSGIISLACTYMRKFHPACRDNFVVLTVVKNSLRQYLWTFIPTSKLTCLWVFIWRNFHPGKRDLVSFKQDLGNQASPLVHINAQYFLL